MSDGKMRNPQRVRACKLYSLHEIAKHCRGGISLTDLDGGVYVGHCRLREGRAILVEFKSEGAPVQDAQVEALEFFVELGRGRVALVLAEHPDLDVVEPVSDVLRFKFCGFWHGTVRWSGWIGGVHFARLFDRFYGDLDSLSQISMSLFTGAVE